MSLIGIHIGSEIHYLKSDISSINEMMKCLDDYRFFKMRTWTDLTIVSEDKFLNDITLGSSVRFVVKPTECIYAYILGVNAYCVLRRSMDYRWKVIDESR